MKNLNKDTEFVIYIANLLIKEGYVKSLREFSKQYLHKNPNTICVMKYQNIEPSLAILLSLYLKLNQKQIYPSIQQQLSKLIYQKTFI